jgi:type IV fimbrial biogenesis protein FimT
MRKEAVVKVRNSAGPGQVRAFGLIELLVALFVAVLLLGLAVPAYGDWVASQELMNEARHLADSMNMARAAAINSGHRVNLCQTAGGGQCLNAGRWEGGWILYVDGNRNGQVDAEEKVLWTEQPAAPGITLAANGPLLHYVSYTSLGHARMLNGALQMGTFTVCRSGRKAIDVVLAHSGRVRIAKTNANCP